MRNLQSGNWKLDACLCLETQGGGLLHKWLHPRGHFASLFRDWTPIEYSVCVTHDAYIIGMSNCHFACWGCILYLLLVILNVLSYLYPGQPWTHTAISPPIFTYPPNSADVPGVGLGPDPSYPEASAEDKCFLFLLIFYHVFCMCICVGVCSSKCNYPLCSEKVASFPWVGVGWATQQGARNQAWAFQRSRKCS